ncbi:hypothetical protein AB6A40_007838 [Gnathostoma spinigerum]|uniref:Insulin-like domain-containing protein n=1 Tax=Gnathostoma spinigerum TaxID=75299 RepID=A0ABD6ESK1_9BILA
MQIGGEVSSSMNNTEMRIIAVFYLIIVCTLEADTTMKLCGNRLRRAMIDVCTYRNQRTPCFRMLRFPHITMARAFGLQSHSLHENCCINGCSLDAIRSTCCFTPRCLKRCYSER